MQNLLALWRQFLCQFCSVTFFLLFFDPFFLQILTNMLHQHLFKPFKMIDFFWLFWFFFVVIRVKVPMFGYYLGCLILEVHMSFWGTTTKIVIKIVIIIVLIAWPIYLLILRTLVYFRLFVWFSKGIFETEGFLTIFFFLEFQWSVTSHNGFYAVVQHHGWRVVILVYQTVLDVLRLLKELSVLFLWARSQSFAQYRFFAN